MKKFISAVLVFLLCVSSFAAVSAQRDTSYEKGLAENLKALNIFRGVSETEFALGRAPTRIEAIVMLIRLLGKESPALETGKTHPFTDVPAWADGYVGFAYENGLTKGVSATKFGTEDANINMYLTFVLRALGYSDSLGDFSYENPFELAQYTGILPGKADKENFLRADVVLISHASLGAYLKGQSTTLAEKLIAEGVFTREKFSKYYVTDESTSSKKELSAEEIYKKCSPAVFYLEVFNEFGEIQGTGSGFFIDSAGTAVTNYHVIKDMCIAKATLPDSEDTFEVEGVYDYSEENDWAVIKIAGENFKFLEIGDESTVEGGATVYAIGSPMGLQNTISNGLISNVNREIDGVRYIQTSAAISHGSSGGAFINKYGEVIGITSAGFVDGENLGLAIPISIIDGYSREKLTTLGEIFGKKLNLPTQNESFSAEDDLYSVVISLQNEKINDSIAYTVRDTNADGYIEFSLVLDPDNSLEVLIWQVYKNSTFYYSLDLTGESRRIYYNFDDLGIRNDFTGERTISPAEITKGYKVKFDKIKGSTNKTTHEDAASIYTKYGLEYINLLLSAMGSNTVADLGFVNFK